MDKAENRLHMLQRNNQKLSAELHLVREENEKLDKSLESMREKELEYADTLAAVHRAWQQLSDDIDYLTQRARSFPNGLKTEVKEEVKQDGNSFLHGDPLLDRLILADHADANAIRKKLEDMADDATEVEKALIPRSIATQQALVALLDLQNRHFADGNSATENSTSGREDDFKSPDDAHNPHAENAHLRREVDAQRAKSRTSQAQLRQLTDMLQKDEKQIQELKNELADRKEQLNAANRKLFTMKENDTLISQNSLPPPVLNSKKSKSPVPQVEEADNSESLQAAEKEARAERDRADSLARQVRELQAKIQDEAFVSQTSSYQSAQRQMQAQTGDLEKARKLVEVLQRECEGCKHHIQALHQQVDEGQHHRRMLHLLEERLREAEVQVSNARAGQEAAELEVQKQRELIGNVQTVRELQSMIAVLEKEDQTNRSRLKNRQGLLADLDAAKKQARDYLTKLEAKDEENKQLTQKLLSSEADLSTLKAQEQPLKLALEDLKVFVEVLQSFCDDPRELAEVRASEAKLKSELQSVQNQLQGHPLQAELTKAKERASKAETSSEESEKERSRLQLETSDLRRQRADLQEQMQSLSAEIEAYTGEMEVIGTAYEEMQGKNSKLLQQLTEKDERINQLVTERIKLQQSAASLSAQRERAAAAMHLAQQQLATVNERLSSVEGKLQESLQDLGQARERATSLAQQVEGLHAEARDRDMALKQKESQLATSSAVGEQRKRALNDEAEKLQRERSKRQRLEDDVKVLQNRIERIGSGEAVNEELEALRVMTHCQVCQSRKKDTVLVKCWHTFCGECIKRNLEARNRKCPACQQTFGAPDVKPIYL